MSSELEVQVVHAECSDYVSSSQDKASIVKNIE